MIFKMINYSKAFQVRVRNIECLKHDLIKLILVHLLKKKNKNTPIYTEYNPINPNESYPDICMVKKDRIYFFEIQKELSKKWVKEVTKKYSTLSSDLIIVPLKDLPTDLNKLIKELEKYVI